MGFKAEQQNVDHLNRLNGKAGKAFGINWMSDRYEGEKHKTGHKKPKGWVPTAPVRKYGTARAPASIDWRFAKAVTPVKNQGQCGSCWAFSATEAIESPMILAHGGSYDFTLSPQQVASCAPSNGTYGCLGCMGGFTEGAYEYVKSAPALPMVFHSIRSEPDGNRGDFAMPNSEGKQHHRPYAGTPRIVCTALWLRVCGKTLHLRCVRKSRFEGLCGSPGGVPFIHLCECWRLEFVHRRCDEFCSMRPHESGLPRPLCHGCRFQHYRVNSILDCSQ